MFCSIFETKTGKETKKQNLFTTVPLQKLNNAHANANVFRVQDLFPYTLIALVNFSCNYITSTQTSSFLTMKREILR